MSKKRLRVFAGPNGSGKSTITRIIQDRFDLGIYVNADDIKKQMVECRSLDFSDYKISVSDREFLSSFSTSPFLRRVEAGQIQKDIEIRDNKIFQKAGTEVNDYFVSFIASFIRSRLSEAGKKFTFETVMSHPSKLAELRAAKEMGYKVYLYFVTLATPQLNKFRVQTRVSQGGHDVDKDKIESRYYRTMDMLLEALKISDNAYLFDNSSGEHRLIAQKENGRLSVLVDYVPEWFQTYVLDKL